MDGGGAGEVRPVYTTLSEVVSNYLLLLHAVLPCLHFNKAARLQR